MSRPLPPLPPEVQTLLDRERVIPSQPASVRARAIARARATLAAGGDASSRVPSGGAARPRWAAAAAVIAVASVAAGAAAYEIRARLLSPPSVASVPAVAATPRAPVAAARTAEPQSAAARASAAPRLSPADTAREELRLLRSARAAVARRDFASALRPIAEHARRFRDGRLAEEREALHVKTLTGLGRIDEARRAAADFKARFPRSVLLPTVTQMPASER